MYCAIYYVNELWKKREGIDINHTIKLAAPL